MPIYRWLLGGCIFKISPLHESGLERRRNLNVLETKAFQLALKRLSFQDLGDSTALKSNSATVVVSLQKLEDTVSRVMWSLAEEIVAGSELHMITLTVSYILRKKNFLANQLSCPDQVLPTGWSLLPWVFDAICEVCLWPHVDLFDLRVNAKLPLYASPVLDSLGLEVRCFSTSMERTKCWHFSPFCSSKAGSVESDAFNNALHDLGSSFLASEGVCRSVASSGGRIS